jgi:hypothetical protein
MTVHEVIDTRVLYEVRDIYWEWRQFCVALQDAYDGWAHAPASQAAAAFREYRRILDLEERVALEYAAVVRRLGP